MSKKHYEQVAKILNRQAERAKNHAPARERAVLCAVDQIAVDLATMFANDNDRFDSERFFKAVASS